MRISDWSSDVCSSDLVARQGSGINGNYKLVMDVRRFEADYAGAAVPAATIEINAKLLHTADQQVAASRTFLASRSAAAAAVPAVGASFDAALHDVTPPISGWVRVVGQQHEQPQTRQIGRAS